MYIRRQSLFLLWVMTAIAAVAYNVTGVVTDRRGSPLPDSTVRILQASDSAFINGNIADNASRFRIGDINSGYNDDEWMWNASVSYQFLSRRQATITLKGYDLLQMRSNVNHTVTANYVDDSRFTSLTRYFMLTFTYKINTLGRGHGGRRGEGHGGGRRGSRRLGRE